MRPLIVNVALTGMVPTKETTPHVPVDTDEILEDVARCAELGAAIFHVHARDDDGVPTHRKEAYAPIVEGIRSIDPELVVCVTCSGRNVSELDRRGEVLELDGDARPDMASLTLGSNNFPRQASVNPPDVIKGLARRMADRGIRPELEVFEPGMIHFGRFLADRGLLEEPCYLNILLGNLGTAPLEAGQLGGFLSLLPEGWTWAAAGIGRYQLPANVMAMAAGGHVRVGVEDNVWYDRERKTLATNEMLVERIVRIAGEMERPLADPALVRETLSLRAPVA